MTIKLDCLRKHNRLILFALFFESSSYAMTEMTEPEMSIADGGSLFALEETAGANGIVFEKLALNAKVEVNMNTRKLALGCGGVNNSIAPGCDIDFDYVSLSGDADTSNGRVDSSAEIINPYYEFAIKNANTKATRELVGIRFASERAKGLLTIGQDNDKRIGLNQISGYMKARSYIDKPIIQGYAYGDPQYLDLAKYPITGKATILGIGGAAWFKSVGGGMWLPGMTNIPYQTDELVINQSRVSTVDLPAEFRIPQIIMGMNKDDNSCGLLANSPCNIYGSTPYGFPEKSTQPVSIKVNGVDVDNPVSTQGGPATVVVTDCKILGLRICGGLGITVGQTTMESNFYGTVDNLKIKQITHQPLSTFHKIKLNSPLSISVQKEAILWPKSPVPALRGWWMETADPVVIGEMLPPDPVSFCTNPNDEAYCLFPQIARMFSAELNGPNAPNTNDLPTLLLRNKALAAQTGHIAPTTILNLTIDGLKLNQDFAPNCRNGALFC